MNALIVLFSVVAASQAQYIASPYAAAPIAAPLLKAAPAPIPAPLTAPSSQFHAQDELANINYGYANINSAKQETGNAYGGVTGTYSYVDAYGIPQRVDYIADALGFRVKATNLPVAPVAPVAAPLAAPVFNLAAPVFDLEAPLPVEDTPEVKAAKAEFQAAYDEAVSRSKRSVALPYTLGSTALNAFPTLGAYAYPYAAGLAAPYAAGLAAPYAAPVAAAAPLAAAYAAPIAAVASPLAYNTVSAPAAREAVLTTIKLNPGHAVAYRVD